MDNDQKQILKDFQKLVKDCKKDQNFFRVTLYLDEKELDDDFQETLILEKLYFGKFSMKNNKTDAIQHALINKCPRLFIALMNRIKKRRAAYVAENNFLQQAIEATSEKERQLEAVLASYQAHKIPINIDGLPESTKDKLYEASWSSEIVKRLYNKTKRFFIPRGQSKAKMYALVYYNTFNTPTILHSTRDNAEKESECMVLGLQEGGFTVYQPKTDWTNEELLSDLREKIQIIKDECSVLFICIMSHGDEGVIYDRDSLKGEINGVLKEVGGLPFHIPAAILIQSCQGPETPKQNVEVELRQIDGENNNSDATAVPGTGTGPHDSRISLVRPNTIVVTATAPGFFASRHIFFYYMAEEIKYSDGRTPFTSMVASCSAMMSQNDDEIYKAQAPMIYSLSRLELVLPRSMLVDNTKVESPGKFRRMIAFADGLFSLGKYKARQTIKGGRQDDNT